MVRIKLTLSLAFGPVPREQSSSAPRFLPRPKKSVPVDLVASIVSYGPVHVGWFVLVDLRPQGLEFLVEE